MLVDAVMSGRMNPEKLKKLQAGVRTGGKGTVRRKKKVVRGAGGNDTKKVAESLKRLGVNPLPGCDEATLFREDGTGIHFKNPKVQAHVQANCFFISGQGQEQENLGMPGGFGGFGGDAGGDDDLPPALVPSFE